MYLFNKLVLVAFLVGFCSVAWAQQPARKMPAGVHMHMIHNVHIVGSVMVVGSHGNHMLIGVELGKPLKGGVKTVAATITHNEPPKNVQISLGVHSGDVADVAKVDITCPQVRVVSYKGKTNAMGRECTLNSYHL